MSELNQVFKCEMCGNMTEVVHAGGGTMVCCGKNMTLMAENTVDAAKEKHVPVIEKIDGGYKVKVGSVPHPMEEKHYMMFNRGRFLMDIAPDLSGRAARTVNQRYARTNAQTTVWY